MKIKTSELIGAPLDWAVAMSLGGTNFRFDTVATYWIDLDGKSRALSKGWAQSFCPSTEGGDALEIMEREKITPKWSELWGQWEVPHPKHAALGILGPTVRIAVCRCFVASKLGDEVDVPEELLK